LRVILADAFEQAEPGAKEIVPMATRKGVNLRTHMERIICKAGHELWPRLFQNLQASCATDWVERYPSHVVAKWLGHSPKVAAQHYLMSRDHHFEDVVKGTPNVPPTPAEEGQKDAAACDANCDSAGGRTGQHRVARNDRTRSQHSGYRGFFGDYAGYQNGPRQEAAQKSARRGHGWPCGREGGRMPPCKNSKPGPWTAGRPQPRQEAAQKSARRGHGWPGGREVAGVGFEPTTSRL
jgi:hypothetical protein